MSTDSITTVQTLTLEKAELARKIKIAEQHASQISRRRARMAEEMAAIEKQLVAAVAACNAPAKK